MSISLCNSVPLANPTLAAEQAPKQKGRQNDRIQQAVQAGLFELGISLAIGIATLPFTASVWAAPVIFGAITAQTALNTGLRNRQLSYSPSSIEFRFYAYLKPWIFSWLSSFNLQLLIHEMGHALAAKTLFLNARPWITITPLWSGCTAFCSTSLSKFGTVFGKNRALFLVAAMGPAYSLLLSATIIVIGYHIQNSQPELSSYLVGCGKGDYFNHAVYAISALFWKNGPNDFVDLAKTGLHPLAAAIGILAIPRLLAWKFADRNRKTEPISDPYLQLIDKFI